MKYFFTFFISFVFSLSIFSQKTKKNIFPFGIIEKIQSTELSEERILNIYLPEGYNSDSKTTYPCIYVLDGSANEDFPHIAGLVQFMNMYDLLPKSIVIGIANIDRYRDFTYPSSIKNDIKAIPTSGGSGNFINFIKNEVQPLIKHNYRVNNHKTIIGQSLGGLLVTEIMIKHNELFDDYIIVSPSLWWDKQRLVNDANIFFNTHPSLNKRIYISLGREHPTMHKVANKLVSAIKNSNNKNITLFYHPILEENHATILHKAVYDAFESLYPSKKSK